jgi:hypothetical protein
MSQEQADRAKQQIYEDTSTRDELTDDEANILLKWGEGQIDSLAAQNLDDAAFEEAYDHLRRVVMNINRFTGKRAYAPPEELTNTLNQLATEAGALGANVSPEQLAVPQAQAADDNIALINALTSMVTVDKTALLNKIQQQAVQPAMTKLDAPPSLEQPDKAALIDKIQKIAQPAAQELAEKLTAEPPDKPQSASADDPDDGDEGLLGTIKDLF